MGVWEAVEHIAQVLTVCISDEGRRGPYPCLRLMDWQHLRPLPVGLIFAPSPCTSVIPPFSGHDR